MPYSLQKQMSQEFQLVPTQAGIRLVPPQHINCTHHHTLPISVKDLLLLDANSYFLRPNSEVIFINDAVAHSFKLSSKFDMLNKTMIDFSPPESAHRMMQADHDVVQCHALKIFDDHIELNDNAIRQFLTFKMPWYNDLGEVLGVFGISILVTQQSLANALQFLKTIGVFHPPKPPLAERYALTKREYQISQYIASGMTAQEIAAAAYLSKRTVEDYINRLKGKFNVNKKSALAYKLNTLKCRGHLQK